MSGPFSTGTGDNVPNTDTQDMEQVISRSWGQVFGSLDTVSTGNQPSQVE